MKYKILLSGTNQLIINDFFNQMEFNFECMCASLRPDDILCHIKYFKPDALVICLYTEKKQDIYGLHALPEHLEKLNIPLVIVGRDNELVLFDKTLPGVADLDIVMPLGTKTLESRLIVFLKTYANETGQGRKHSEDDAFDSFEDGDEAEEDSASWYDVPSVEADFPSIDPSAPPALIFQKEKEKKHILIIDDDSSVLKLVKGYLGQDYQVATALSGKIALKFLEKKDTDLILLDYEMPEESGAQILLKIRSDRRLKDLPVVFLTGVTEKERIQEVLALKPQGYLLKPISTDKLSSTLKKVLGE